MLSTTGCAGGAALPDEEGPEKPRARFLGKKQKTGLVAEEINTMVVPTDDYKDAVRR